MINLTYSVIKRKESVILLCGVKRKFFSIKKKKSFFFTKEKKDIKLKISHCEIQMLLTFVQAASSGSIVNEERE